MLNMTNLIRAVAIINSGFKAKQMFIHIPKSKQIMVLVDALFQNGIITSYFIKPSESQIILYYDYAIDFNISMLSSSRSNRYISLEELMKRYKGAPLCLIGTKKGIVTLDKAIAARSGGEALVLVHLGRRRKKLLS